MSPTNPRPSNATIIEAEELTVRFDDLTALDGIDLSIANGGIHGLLGPNGSGKTTLVRVIATLLRPSAGTVRVAGHDVLDSPDAVRRTIGLAGQHAAVDDLLTGRENLEIVGRLYGLPRRKARERSAEVLERLSLTEAADRLVGTYSGGMRRRLDLGASLVGRPLVLLLDEPTTGLDPRTRIGLWDFLRDLVGQGTTVLLTTQYLEEADALADRITVIDRGSIIAEGTADALKDRLGGSHLIVAPSDRHALVDTARILDGLVAASARIDHHIGSVTIAVENRVDDLVTAAAALGAARIELADINVVRPSLDDVFLEITGRSTNPTIPTIPDNQRTLYKDMP